MEYESHEERCANHSLPYSIEYESHEERCAYDVEYESEQKTEESSVKFSWEETVAHLAIEKVESVDIKNMFLEVDESSLQEFSIQELVDEESTLGSVPPSLCSGGSSSSGSSCESASASEFTVSGSTITVDTAELTDISIEELEDDIVSYTNKEMRSAMAHPSILLHLSTVLWSGQAL